MSDLKTCFQYHRLLGAPATLALHAARLDVANNRDKYPSSLIYTGYSSGKPFEAYGSKHMRWIENPRSAGLRFVGYAHELVRMDHTGWFVDNDQNEVVRGVVFQIAGRGRKPLFIAGYEDWNNGKADSNGPVCLDFGTIFEGEAPEWNVKYRYWSWTDSAKDHDGAREAARRADSIAERVGEQERAYQAAWQAGNRYGQLSEEVKTTRRSIIAAIKELRVARSALNNDQSKYGTLCGLVRSKVESMLEDIREARGEMEKLKSGEYVSEWLPGFYPSKELQAAFNEGANI